MTRSMIPVALAFAGVAAAATIGLTAMQKPDLPANDPGRPTHANVWVQNRDSSEAIPVTFPGKPVVALEPNAAVLTRVAPQQWSYRSLSVRNGEDPATALSTLGIDGWEAVGVTATAADHAVILLKKPREATR